MYNLIPTFVRLRFIKSSYSRTILVNESSKVEENVPAAPQSTSLSSRQLVKFVVGLIREKDLAELIWRLEVKGGDHLSPQWKTVVNKSSSTLQYCTRIREKVHILETTKQ